MTEQDVPVIYTPSDVTEDLTAAAMWGDAELLESLLQNGADPNLPNAQGNTALHVACYYGERECANILLNYKAEVNAKGADGKTPLHRAVLGVLVLEPGSKYSTKDNISNNQIDLVKLLVGKGGFVTVRDNAGDTPYDLAIQCDFYVCAELLEELAKNEQKEIERQIYFQKIDDVYDACQSGELEKVKELLPDVIEVINQSKKYHMSLLMIASREGHLPIVEYLVDQGAIITRTPDRTARTALHFAAENGHAPVVAFLIKHLPKLLIADDSGDGTSLHLAARHGHIDVVKIFLEAATRGENYRTPCKSNAELTDSISLDSTPPEVHINVFAQSPVDSRTPLHEAVIEGHTEIVRCIISWLKNNSQKKSGFLSPSPIGLSPLPSPSGPLPSPVSPRTPQTPLTSSGAIRTPSQSSATKIDLLTERGRTPLHEASRLNHTDIIELLLDGGADINSVMRPSIDRTANADLTALVQAAMMNDVNMVRFLLQHGATDARLKALTRVLRMSHNDVAGLLLCYNGSVTVDTAGMELRKRAGKETNTSPLLISVNWASKKLPYIHPSWLEAVITESPKPAADFYAMSQLNVSDNNLSELPLAVFQLECLSRLDVSRNSISSLPVPDPEEDSPWLCCSLNHIDISNNNLNTLPINLFNLPELKELFCNNNAIREVPIEVWQAPKLQKLLLQRNQLESFPSPLALRDSGFNTLETTPPDHNQLNISLSMPDISFAPKSGPITVPFMEKGNVEIDPKSTPFKRGRLQTTPGQFFTMSQSVSSAFTDRRVSYPSNMLLRSRLRELFDTQIEGDVFEDFEIADVLETNKQDTNKELFQLETLDLSYNELTSLPSGLCCLAPRLQKLHLHHNKLKSLGCITDFPADIELLDTCNNQLTTPISCAPPRENLRNLSCAQKLLQISNGSLESATPTRCSHRTHRVLRKLGYLKLAHNQLVDIQLFRTTEREHNFDLTSSMDDSRLDRRLKSYSETSFIQKNFSKSSVGFRGIEGAKGSASSNEGSSDESRERKESSSSSIEVLYCLYPQLSTIDLGYNKLRSVPSHIHLISTLSVLNISHNVDIDTLPLEISNLDGLWSLEYDGVPLTNPPASDLDKFRSAADKLLYMRSLLHDAKPNESMKLMLVGLQKQGKTTLLSRLREINEAKTSVATFNERIEGENPSVAASIKPTVGFFKKIENRDEPLSTVGVDLGIWKYRKDLEPSYRGRKGTTPLRSVTFYTWDFGGQEEYYATHQCFLSNRSLYLVVWDVTDGEDGIDSLGPWLHNIQARAPDSPVVIIGTHCDMLKGDAEKERRKTELIHYLKEKYLVGHNSQQLRELGLPQIRDIIFVGCPSTGRTEGVAELRMSLWDIAFSLTAPRKKGGAVGGTKAKLLEQPVPSSYLRLQEEVRKLAMTFEQEVDESPVMKDAQFREAVQHIIPNARELDQAVTFLHENGILLHYSTPALNHLYFIDPQWLCDMLAHVVTVPEVNRFIQRGSGPEAGILKTSVLSHIFKGKLFPQSLRREYIELLGKFEVALLLDRNRLLVPSMLPLSPRHTMHCFKTIFPRPSINYLLDQAQHHVSVDQNFLSPFSVMSDPLIQKVPMVFSTEQTPPIYRTGLLLRRFYFMTYVPSGFWPRLVSRFLTVSDFSVIVLKALGFNEKQINEIVKVIIAGDVSTIINLEWSYWKTGVEFWYQDYSLLRVAEIRPDGTFQDCIPKSNITGSGRTPTIPFEPSEDCDDLSFQLHGQWLAVDQTPNTGLEILVPDYICPLIIEKEIPVLPNEEDESNFESHPLHQRESSWMAAQLLALIVQQIDTLLEDWFPGIGAKDGGRTLYSIPYVNRVIPCPYCVGGAVSVNPKDFQKFSKFDSADVPNMDESHFVSTPVNSMKLEPGDHDSKVRRDLLPSLKKLTNYNSPLSKRRQLSDDTLDGTTTPEPSCVPMSTGLIQASKFGFMIETCVAASRGLETLICPAHPDHPLDLLSLTPDLVFGDLPTHFIIDERLVDKGKYVTSGSFGEIYHGAIYPHLSASDDEGREIAVKIDKQDRKHFNMETATKAYNEIRAEVAILKDLRHDYVIEFIGLTLQPLCFLLEWAPLGSLHNILTSYLKNEARLSPWTLVETARQVASGLGYLHSLNIVYYDLKSPNILAFEFPTADQSVQIAVGYSTVHPRKLPVRVKIADLGISRKNTPGGVVGYKGTPAFMAPEILKYVGMEACTEKVDVFSFGMFMYELLAQQFPFERQNLMHNQIEKIIIDGDRPSLQNKELNNPILYLDIMKWAWEQDYRDRPSSSQLESVLTTSAVPHLVDAYSLQGRCHPKVTSACIVTHPIDISSQTSEDGDSVENLSTSSLAKFHTSVVQGDLQEEVWFCSEIKDLETNIVDCKMTVVSFCGRANFSVETISVGCSSTLAMCCVNQQVWLGTVEGQLMVYDALNQFELFNRHLAIKSDQGIVFIGHLTTLRQVLVVRQDGCLILFDDYLLEQRIPDTHSFDNHVNATQLPVRAVTYLRQPIYCVLTLQRNDTTSTVWCGTNNEVLLSMDITSSQIHYYQKHQARTYAQTSAVDILSHLCTMIMEKNGKKIKLIWALSSPGRMLYLWDAEKGSLVMTLSCDDFTTDDISDLLSINNHLYLGTSSGQVVTIEIDSLLQVSTPCLPMVAHSRGIHNLLSLGSRVLPRQWLPTLIGRSNVIEYYQDLLEEDEVDEIMSRMIGKQSQLLITVGQGFHGLSGFRVVDSSIQNDLHDNFVLLWLPPR